MIITRHNSVLLLIKIKYYRDKASGDIKPGKKGITLDSTQWASLVANTAPLTKQLELTLAEGAVSAKGTKAKESGKETKSEEYGSHISSKWLPLLTVLFSRNKQKPAKKKKKPSDSEVEDDDE